MDAETRNIDGICPLLIAVQVASPARAKRCAESRDASVANSGSHMPPFGTYKTKSESDIDAIVEYVCTL